MYTKSINRFSLSINAHFLALAIVFLVGYSSSCIATITQIHDPKKCPDGRCWEITGLITQSDLQELSRAVDIMRGSKATPIFRLNSNGGDIEVAIAIGRQLRQFRALALTWGQGKCYSSCVFILAGAVYRMLSTTIGIHRPYSIITDKRDYQTIQSDQRRLAKIAKDYLEEVNVSPSLYDAMIIIPPEKIKLLSESELEGYGLLEVDPVEQELDDAAEARKYSLSKVEYFTRKAKANIICASDYNSGALTGNIDSYYACYKDVLRSTR